MLKPIPRPERSVTDAAVHDSQVVEDILDADNTASDVWADSAYRSAEIEAKLGEKGLKSRIHRKGHRNKPLNEREKRGNETRSKVRARMGHVFGGQSNDMGGTLVRGIGLVRAKARIGLKNLAYTPVPTTGKIWSSIRSTTCLCWSTRSGPWIRPRR